MGHYWYIILLPNLLLNTCMNLYNIVEKKKLKSSESMFGVI